MFSYQHRYHAGHMADIHKHIALIAILEHLCQKSTPFGVLDAFAGEGLYNLNSKESQKNKEFLQGFARIQQTNDLPLFKTLVNIAQSYQQKIADKSNMVYPGSPSIIAHYLRAMDSAILVEGHPAAYQTLKMNFGQVSNINIHKRDSFEALYALTPLVEKRGLIFIDPSYEVKADYRKVAETIIEIYAKFSNGIYMIWYPILANNYHYEIFALIKKLGIKNIAQSEWLITDMLENKSGLQGSGILVINPIWKLDNLLKEHKKYFSV